MVSRAERHCYTTNVHDSVTWARAGGRWTPDGGGNGWFLETTWGMVSSRRSG